MRGCFGEGSLGGWDQLRAFLGLLAYRIVTVDDLPLEESPFHFVPELFYRAIGSPIS